jgi:hypothetical protein
MKSLALLLLVSVVLFPLLGCARADAAAGTSPELRVVRSFREMGVRKTAIQVDTASERLEVTAVRGSAGIGLPEFRFPIPVAPKGPLVFEIVWEEPVREGTVCLTFAGRTQELALRVAYP